MPNYQSSEDRPDPSEQPIRARVPEHVSGGAFSTGVIVMTAQTEFILDFVQNLGRPHQIVARVVMPHNVLPQLVDALHRNMELYRGRWGELPQPAGPVTAPAAGRPAAGPAGAPGKALGAAAENDPPTEELPAKPSPAAAALGSSGPGMPATKGDAGGIGGVGGRSAQPADFSGGEASAIPPLGNSGQLPPAGAGARQASAQEIYDDLKIRDELLSGAYANAVMIGHGPHEFSFDFITNFYPHSAVSARVFLAAGQVPRFYDSLRGTWDQLRQRLQPPDNPPPPFPASDEGHDPRGPLA